SQAGHERFHLEPGFYFRTLSNPRLTTSLLIFFLATFAFANMETTLALLAMSWYKFSKTDMSWLFTYIGFVMVFVQGGLIGRLSKKVGERPLITVGSCLVFLGLLLTVLLHSVPGLYLSMTLLAAGTSIINPSNQSMTSRLADQQQVGGVLGVGQSLSTLGRVLGPCAGGLAFQFLGVQFPYYVGAAVMLLVILLSLALPKLEKAQSSVEPAKAGV
ncbi:MAG: MFS transporter, partial [Candidatus Obscuribacterales bacterium]|nr:MFS transporter [Candidatus Obscuribacterales bacterium]